MKSSGQWSEISGQLTSEKTGHRPPATDHCQFGFTLIEILVSITILSIVMSILYGTFSTSSANAKVIEERADELSSLTGAMDVLSQEVRGAFISYDAASELFSGKKEEIRFTAATPFVKEDEPAVQRVSYLFDGEKLIRKTSKEGQEAEVERESLILEGANGPSFSFFNGKEWIEEWPAGKSLPYGIKITFSYKGKEVNAVIPILSTKR